jgi:hypothetical protein
MVADVGVAARVISEIDHQDSRRGGCQLVHTENPEMIFAAANQSICGDFAWTLLALEQLREPIA